MTVKKIYQVHGVISYVCKFIKCMKIIPTFKCLIQLFITDRGLLHKLGEKQGYKS